MGNEINKQKLREERVAELLELGQQYFAKQFFRNAKEYFYKACQLDPENSDALNAYAATLIELNEAESSPEAEEILLKAIKVNGQNPRAWNNLGKYYYLQGDIPLAIEIMEKTAELAPKSAVVHGNLASAYRLNDQFDEALKTLQKGIELNSRSAWLRFQLGLTYLLRGIQKDTELDFEKAKTVFVYIKKEMQLRFELMPTPSWVRLIDYCLAVPLNKQSLLPILYRYVPEHTPYLGKADPARLLSGLKSQDAKLVH